MATKTAITASHILTYVGEGHRHLQDGVVVYEGNTIVYVGKAYAGAVDHTIDATGKVVTPGFINTHAHLAGLPLTSRLSRTVATRSSIDVHKKIREPLERDGLDK
jgi:cytosine/adenosine deaminase-related metal-dependent hydrolase